jgi:hypothetical protein
LSCGDIICKSCLAKHIINKAIIGIEHNYICYCSQCKSTERFIEVTLTCGCKCSTFTKKLTLTEHNECNNKHPLSYIDFCIITNECSFKFTALMIAEYGDIAHAVLDLYTKHISKEDIKTIF